MEKNYSLLRPFDLEAAKRGDLLTTFSMKSVCRYVSGPDGRDLCCFKSDDLNHLFIIEPASLRMPPSPGLKKSRFIGGMYFIQKLAEKLLLSGCTTAPV